MIDRSAAALGTGKVAAVLPSMRSGVDVASICSPGICHKVPVEPHKLNWPRAWCSFSNHPSGSCKQAASTSAHGQGPRAADSADQAVGVGGRARKCQQDFSQIWPTPTRRAPAGATVSRELAGGLSHSLICDQTITEYELEKRKGANATGRPQRMIAAPIRRRIILTSAP